MRKKLLAGAGALVAAAVAFLSISTGGGNLVAETQARRRMLSATGDSGSVLSVLSPPGAGYDATNVALYTGSGAAVTVTRASTQTCGQPGQTLTSVANDKPCVDQGRLLVEPAATNGLLRSGEIENASWTDRFTPIVTANAWDSGSGSNTGETIQDDDGTNNEGRDSSSIGTTTGAYTFSCYLQSGTLTHVRLGITTDGTGTTDCTITGLSATTTRGSCTATVGGTPTTIKGAIKVGTTGTDTGTVKVDKCQLETGSVATSYIPTAGATASRAAQTTTVATHSSINVLEGAAKVCITPNWTGTSSPAFPEFIDVIPGGNSTLYSSATNAAAFDGTAAVAANWTLGVRQCFRTSWSASRNQLRIENLTTGASAQAAFASLGSVGATTSLGGGQGSTGNANSLLDSICFNSSPDGCR